MGNYNLAIKYHSKALSLSQSQNLKSEGIPISFEGTSLNNLGNAYRELKQYDKALYYLNKASKNKEMILIDPELKGYLFNNIGFCLMNKNIAKTYITKYFKTAAKVFDSLQMKNEAAISRIYLAEYYAKMKDTTTAIKYTDKALQLAKESKSSYYYLYTLSNAGTINKQKAPQYIAEYHRLNDSLLFEERKARNQYFKIQLETDEIAQQKEKAIKQKWVQTSIIASVLLIVILLFIIYKQRSQKKEFILIQNQQKASEEIYQLMLNQQSKEEEAKQKEKKRIAIELHDNVMNKLASTRFNLFSLTKKSDSQSLKQAVQHIDSIKEVEDEIRNITHELSKETFSKNNSFTTLLTQLINEQNQIHPTLYQLELDDSINWDIISSEIKMNYYRIIQEAIHNCNKYAAAKHSTISLFYEVNQLRLTISDNGKGFQANTTNPGIGLQNMKQRMESIHGKISINSEPGKGTAINCSVEIDVN
jgi:signal transduction histidine kinase